MGKESSKLQKGTDEKNLSLGSPTTKEPKIIKLLDGLQPAKTPLGIRALALNLRDDTNEDTIEGGLFAIWNADFGEDEPPDKEIPFGDTFGLDTDENVCLVTQFLQDEDTENMAGMILGGTDFQKDSTERKENQGGELLTHGTNFEDHDSSKDFSQKESLRRDEKTDVYTEMASLQSADSEAGGKIDHEHILSEMLLNKTQESMSDNPGPKDNTENLVKSILSYNSQDNENVNTSLSQMAENEEKRKPRRNVQFADPTGESANISLLHEENEGVDGKRCGLKTVKERILYELLFGKSHDYLYDGEGKTNNNISDKSYESATQFKEATIHHDINLQEEDSIILTKPEKTKDKMIEEEEEIDIPNANQTSGSIQLQDISEAEFEESSSSVKEYSLCGQHSLEGAINKNPTQCSTKPIEMTDTNELESVESNSHYKENYNLQDISVGVIKAGSPSAEEASLSGQLPFDGARNEDPAQCNGTPAETKVANEMTSAESNNCDKENELEDISEGVFEKSSSDVKETSFPGQLSLGGVINEDDTECNGNSIEMKHENGMEERETTSHDKENYNQQDISEAVFKGRSSCVEESFSSAQLSLDGRINENSTKCNGNPAERKYTNEMKLSESNSNDEEKFSLKQKKTDNINSEYAVEGNHHVSYSASHKELRVSVASENSTDEESKQKEINSFADFEEHLVMDEADRSSISLGSVSHSVPAGDEGKLKCTEANGEDVVYLKGEDPEDFIHDKGNNSDSDFYKRNTDLKLESIEEEFTPEEIAAIYEIFLQIIIMGDQSALSLEGDKAVEELMQKDSTCESKESGNEIELNQIGESKNDKKCIKESILQNHFREFLSMFRIGNKRNTKSIIEDAGKIDNELKGKVKKIAKNEHVFLTLGGMMVHSGIIEESSEEESDDEVIPMTEVKEEPIKEEPVVVHIPIVPDEDGNKENELENKEEEKEDNKEDEKKEDEIVPPVTESESDNKENEVTTPIEEEVKVDEISDIASSIGDFSESQFSQSEGTIVMSDDEVEELEMDLLPGEIDLDASGIMFLDQEDEVANKLLKASWDGSSTDCVPDADGLDPTLHERAIKMGKMLREAQATCPPGSPDMEGIQSKVTLQAYGLKIGDRVVVGGVKTGTLRFCGPTEFASGIWAGIELDEDAGKNDGSVGGVPYFKCSPKHGIFAPITKISKPGGLLHRSAFKKKINHGGVDTSHVKSRLDTDSASEQVLDSAQEKNEEDKDYGRNRPRPARVCGPQPSPEEMLKDGDRVLVAGQRRGHVRYCGTTDFAPGWWYGVELDRPVGKNDGSVNGRRYFTCKPKSGVFAPPSRIQRISDNPDASECLDSVPEHHRRLSACPESSHQNKPKSSHTRVKSAGSSVNPSSVRKLVNLTMPGAEFRLQEGVSVFCNNELGVIQYMGPVDFAEGIWLGVELRSAKGKNDGSVQGRRYFTCKPNHGLLVRPSKVSVRGINGAKLMGNMENHAESDKKDTD